MSCRTCYEFRTIGRRAAFVVVAIAVAIIAGCDKGSGGNSNVSEVSDSREIPEGRGTDSTNENDTEVGVDDSLDETNAAGEPSPQSSTGYDPTSVADTETNDEGRVASTTTSPQDDAADVPSADEAATEKPATELNGVAKLKRLGADVEMGVGDRVIGIDLKDTNTTDADLVHLSDLNELKTLNLSGTKVTDKGLGEIVKLRRLKFLYLYGANITDDGVKQIKEMDRLEVLCLDETHITDNSLESLSGLRRLEKLHVQTTKTMSDEGLMKLASLTKLFELRIPHGDISDEAVKALKKKLPRCKIERPDTPPEKEKDDEATDD